MHQYQRMFRQMEENKEIKSMNNYPLQLIPPIKAANQEQQLKELSQIRLKLENYNGMDNRKPFKDILSELDFKTKQQQNHRDPTLTTISEIDQLIQDYQIGGQQDKTFLTNLERLRHDFVEKTTQQQYYVKPNAVIYSALKKDKHYQNAVSNNHTFSKLQLIPSQYLDQNSQLTLPPINEISNNNSRKNDYNTFKSNKSSQVTISQEQKEETDRINKLAQSMIHHRYKSQPDDIPTMRFNQVQNLYVLFEFISKLPMSCARVNLSFKVVKINDTFLTHRKTQEYLTMAESYRTNKAQIHKIEQLTEITNAEKCSLYIELWCWNSESLTSQMAGWTALKMIDINGLISIGSFKLPFYPQQFNPKEFLDFGRTLPYIGNQSLYLQIVQNQQNLNIVFDEKDYNIPYYHLHKEAKIISDINNIQKEDQNNIFAFDKPLKEREPQLFGLQPIRSKQKLDTDDYFKPQSQRSILKHNDQKEQKSILGNESYKINKNEHLNQNLIESQNQISSNQIGSKLKIQLIENFDSQRSIKNGEATIRSRGGDRTKKQTILDRYISQQQQIGNTSSQNIQSFKQLSRFRKRQQTDQSRASSRGDYTSKGKIESPIENSKNNIKTNYTTVIFDILKLSHFNAQKYTELKVKVGFFVNDIIIRNIDNVDCILNQNLKVEEKGNTFLKYKFHSEFTLDFDNLLQVFKNENFNSSQCFLYLAIQSQGQLFGWYVLDIFKQNSEFEINSGLYQVNLIDPPGQQAPFNDKHMIKSNTQLDFILMNKSQQLKDIPTYQKYITQQSNQIREVNNIEWNTQIMIQILSIQNCNNRQDLTLNISIQYENNIIEDVLKRFCEFQNDLDLFPTEKKTQFNSHYYTTFRIGSKYLKDNFKQLDLLNYTFTIKQNGSFIAMSSLNLFKKSNLQIGEYKINTYSITNKKLDMQIQVHIKETPLQLDQYEQTQSYRISKKKGGYTQEQDEQNQQEQKVTIQSNQITTKNDIKLKK